MYIAEGRGVWGTQAQPIENWASKKLSCTDLIYAQYQCEERERERERELRP